MTSATETQSARPARTPARGSARWRHRRDLLRELIARDMKLRYRGSVLGMAWTLLNPIAELLVLLFVFGVVLALDIPNYPVFLFSGLIVYGWFQNSLFFATATIVSNRELIRHPDVPPAILPVVTVASSLLHFLLSLPVLFGLLIANGIALTSSVLALPLLVAVQFVLILAFAYPLATIHVWLRDTQYFLRVALQLLFYMTPVFYDLSTIPERFRAIFRLNPMVTVVEGYRHVLLGGQWPPLRAWLVLAILSGAALAVGLFIFQRASRRFPDEI